MLRRSLQTVNPGTLNSWLQQNGGYEGNDLIESALEQLNPDHITYIGAEFETVDPSVIAANLQSEVTVSIANVMNGML